MEENTGIHTIEPNQRLDFIRPEVLNGYTPKLTTPCGSLYLTLNECENKLCEVRMTLGKSGTCTNILFQTIALFISFMIQEGVKKQRIYDMLNKQFEGNCGQKVYYDGEPYHSCVDFMFKKIVEDMASRGEIKLEEQKETQTM